jgi:hypothetical protein
LGEKGRKVHRLVYQRLKGRIPKNQVVTHSCGKRACYNPHHLELRGSGPPIRSRDGNVRRLRAIRFSDGEWGWLQEQAEGKGVGVSEFIRERVLKGMAVG